MEMVLNDEENIEEDKRFEESNLRKAMKQLDLDARIKQQEDGVLAISFVTP